MTDHSDNGTFSPHIFRRNMRQYLSNELPNAEVGPVEQHLKFCEKCSLSMIAIVDNEDPDNHKKNLEKVKNKLNVAPKGKSISFKAPSKKQIMVAASTSVLAFSAFAFYNFAIEGNEQSFKDRFSIPSKPKREAPEALSFEKKAEEATPVEMAEKKEEHKVEEAKKEEKAVAEKPKEEKPVIKEKPAALPEVKAEEKKKPETPDAKEKPETEISNSVLVARRKEPSETNNENKVSAEVSKSETEPTSPEEEKIIDASPTGGYGAFNQYVSANLQYPEDAKENNIEGMVSVEFLVRDDGSLTNFSVKKPLGFGCDQEAIRLIKNGPKWVSATKNGKAIMNTVTVTVNFKQAQ